MLRDQLAVPRGVEPDNRNKTLEENTVSPNVMEIQGSVSTSVSLEEWRGRRGSRIHVDRKVGREDRHYFMPPSGRIHISGASHFQLPAIAILAIKRAEQLDGECVLRSALQSLDAKNVALFSRIVRGAFAAARKRAEKRKTPFRITVDYVDRLLVRQKYLCAVSGMPFRDGAEKAHGVYRAAFRPSLDRIVPAKGYVPGNVRLVLTIVNIAMSDWGEDVLIEVAQAIVKKRLSE